MCGENPITNEKGCPLLFSLPVLTVVQASSVHTEISIVHECGQCCRIEHTTFGLVYVHDYSNNLFLSKYLLHEVHCIIYSHSPELIIQTCYKTCSYTTVEYKLYQAWYHYNWTAHLLQYVLPHTGWAALNPCFNFVVYGSVTDCAQTCCVGPSYVFIQEGTSRNPQRPGSRIPTHTCWHCPVRPRRARERDSSNNGSGRVNRSECCSS